jgi:iron complex transport system substrate-binding protein
VTPEDLAAADPDVVLLSSEPFPFKERHTAELAVATGLPRERMQLVDGEYLTWHGSRTPDGVDYAERVIALTRGAASQRPGRASPASRYPSPRAA